MDKVRTLNRAIFFASVASTGALAGAFVWLLLFLMNLGISFVWDRVPAYLGRFYPVAMCVIGGIAIGLFSKRFGNYPEDLGTVTAKVKKNGRYDYGNLAPMSVGALLPMVFGGSVGPEAGLAGIVAALCTWAGDRLRRFGGDFRRLSEIGVYAAVSAVFTAPLYGFAGATGGEKIEEKKEIAPTRIERTATYVVAAVGAALVFLLLSGFFGGGLSLPRYTEIVYGAEEFLWLVPIALVGASGGWMFRILDASFENVSDRFGNRPVLTAAVAGLILGICGMILPLTMFAGEIQAEELNETWMTMTVPFLLAVGFAKIAATAMCVNMGWRGGHFFPVIFSGIAIGYGLAMFAGIDPVFGVCAATASVVGGVTRKPLIAVLLLFLCFPFHSAAVMAVAAAIGAYFPLPEKIGKQTEPAAEESAASERLRNRDGCPFVCNYLNFGESTVLMDESSQKFCSHCGASLAADARFCSKCGTMVPGMNPEQVRRERQAVRTASQTRLRYASYLMLAYSIPFLIIGIYILAYLDSVVSMLIADPNISPILDDYGVTGEQVRKFLEYAGYVYVASSVCGIVSAVLCIRRKLFWVAALLCVASIILGVAGFFALFMGLFAFWMIISGKLGFTEYENQLEQFLEENIRRR